MDSLSVSRVRPLVAFCVVLLGGHFVFGGSVNGL